MADADDILAKRKNELEGALSAIRDNHLDSNEQPLSDRSTGGLAIRNFETWLLADIQTVAKLLGIQMEPLENLESLNHTKDILDGAIAQSTDLSRSSNQRPLQIRWDLATQIDLEILKTSCPEGYATFSQDLRTTASHFLPKISF